MNKTLVTIINSLPSTPGVYLFKDREGMVLYVGKAKNLRQRVKSYVQQYGKELKATSLMTKGDRLDHIQAGSELEAMLLEAELIQNYKPAYNVLLKDGQPFLYFLITSEKVPRLELVRNKKRKGTYIGPFLEKGSVRKVYTFLKETFQLVICNKRITQGCLAYHMGRCAGACRPDFDKEAYVKRLMLVKRSLKSVHKHALLEELDEAINTSNKEMTFEYSRQLVRYKEALLQVMASLEAHKNTHYDRHLLSRKDIWILYPVPALSMHYLFLFYQEHGHLRKREMFGWLTQEGSPEEKAYEYFESYYRHNPPGVLIITTFSIPDKEVFHAFLTQWHKLLYQSTITTPQPGEAYSDLVTFAKLASQAAVEKKEQAPVLLKKMLNLTKPASTIDCFDISHKQGYAMVGSCVRFHKGFPEKHQFRHFHIRSVAGQNDYLSLQEIVSRRYKKEEDLPDLIVIDGGKGQLHAIEQLLEQRGWSAKVDLISLAKREETVFSKALPDGKVLDRHHLGSQILIALRDYAHHFAISFHRKVFQRSSYQEHTSE